jgi:hypoxanthine phosphoribosyltransferase
MKKLVIEQTQFQKLIAGICRDIVVSNWRPDYIVGISRGGLPAAVMISHYLNVPMKPLAVSLRDGGECVSDLNMAAAAIEDPDSPKNILIVDDINDTGATFNWIINDWVSSCYRDDPRWKQVWGNNVRFAVVVDNLTSDCKVSMSYSGIEINKELDDVWVEFPYENWWAQ